MDVSYKQEVTVGALVLLAVVLFIVGLTWLSGRSVGVREGEFWQIRFADVGNLKASSVVRISGVPVGRVEGIRLVEVGNVLVAVSLPERIVPKVDATATIVPVGFVGDAAVQFDPGQASEPLPRDRVIHGTQRGGITDRAEVLGARVDTLLTAAQEIVNDQTADQLRGTLNTLQGTLRAAQRTMELYGSAQRGPTAELTRTMASFRELSQRFEQLGTRLDSTLANPALARTLERTDTLTARLSAMSSQFARTGAQLDSLLAGVSRGRGTVGKLATDTGVYRDMRELSQSMKRLVDELQKNPGKIGVTFRVF